MNCVFCQILNARILKLSLPSISYAFWTFKLSKGSMTVIGHRAIFASNSEIVANGQISIGKKFCINKFSRVVAKEKITIGDNVTIAQFVAILDHDHAYHFENGNMIFRGYKTSPIVIGNNVWIADKVTICKGVSIGSNVIIGANSVVISDIQDNCIAAGNPAKLIREMH